MQGGGDGSPPEESERRSHYNGDSNWLPDGWTVDFKTRKGGNSKGKQYKCYVSARGRKCYSKKQVSDYLEKIGRTEAHENTDNANRSTLDLSTEPENEVIGSSPGGPPPKLATRSNKRKSLGAEGVSAGGSGSSSVKESDAVELPWTMFCSAVSTLYYRKLLEKDPEDKRLKEKVEVAEEDVHYLRQYYSKNVPDDWNYNHETASNIVSRRDGDSGKELCYITTHLERAINAKHNRKRNCCFKQSERENRRFGAMLGCQWAKYRKTLRVENLHFSTDEVDFTERFEAFGPVLVVQFPKDPETGHCEGLAHIEFVKLAHAKAAAQSLNGTKIAGQTIKILSCADHLEALRQGEKAASLVLSYADHLREQKQQVW
uniref:uncharacterized protein LOC122604524 n=1 Tax=Erigeron canadensis TaxID=72917 RepID=UPI001CB9BF5F|nr:uncharacterized protein LOC122604524 [Erigeron canadensis]